MKNIAAVLIISILFCSCSSTVQFSSLNEANKRLYDQTAVIYLNKGQTYNGREIKFSDTSAIFINQMNDSLVTIRTRDISSIYVRHRAGGAIEGLLIGTCIGAAGGLIGDMNMGTSSRVKAGSMVGGILGGIAGCVLGISKGHEYSFIMPKDTTALQEKVTEDFKKTE